MAHNDKPVNSNDTVPQKMTPAEAQMRALLPASPTGDDQPSARPLRIDWSTDQDRDPTRSEPRWTSGE